MDNGENLVKIAPSENALIWKTMPTYLERVEEIIRDGVREHGLQSQTGPNRERLGINIDYFVNRLTDVINELSGETGYFCDPNINYMVNMSLLSFAWSVFIMEAKSQSNRMGYSESNKVIIKSLVDSMPLIFAKIHGEAVKLGDEYNLDNSKWLQAVEDYKKKQAV